MKPKQERDKFIVEFLTGYKVYPFRFSLDSEKGFFWLWPKMKKDEKLWINMDDFRNSICNSNVFKS